MGNEDLLKPSLEAGRSEPIYSVGALVATAFFGGAMAVPLLGAANARRLGRLRQDLPAIAGLFLLGAATLVVAIVLWPPEESGRVDRNVRIAGRVVAFVMVGCFYLMHRGPYRSMNAMGIEPPSPWVPVIIAVAVGTVLNIAAAMAALLLVPGAAS